MPKKVWSSGSYIHASDINNNNNQANAAEAVPRDHMGRTPRCASFVLHVRLYVACRRSTSPRRRRSSRGLRGMALPWMGVHCPPPHCPPPAPPPPVPEPSMPPVAYGKAGPREFVLLVWLVCFIDALHAGPVGRDKAKVPGGGVQAGLLGTRPDTSVSAEPCFVATGSSCRRVRPGLRGQLGRGVTRGVRAGTCPHERRAGSQEARCIKKINTLKP